MNTLKVIAGVIAYLMAGLVYLTGALFWADAYGFLGLALAFVIPPLSFLGCVIVIFSSVSSFLSYLVWFAVIALLAFFATSE